MTPPISFDVHSYLFLPYTFPCFCTMFFAYIFFLIGLRLCHRTFLFFFRYDVQWYQRSGGTFFFLFFSFSFLFFSFSFLFFFFFLFAPHESSRLWWRDDIWIRVWLSVLCSWSQQYCDIFWDYSWLPGARFLSCLMSHVSCFMSHYVSSPINFVGSDMFSFRFLRDHAQISNNQTYRSLHGVGQ